MSVRFSKTTLTLLGSGSALPGPPVTTERLLEVLEKHCGSRQAKLAARFVGRLGISHRHLSRDLEAPVSGTLPGCEAPQLCALALRDTTAFSRMSFLIGHTSTPHTLLPPNVSWVADELRFEGPYQELRQACTGFASAVTTAAALICENPEETVGIVGSETGSPFFDFSPEFVDREQIINCLQMGDGAGAAVVCSDDGSGRHRISDIYTGHIGLGMEPGISIRGGGSGDPAGDARLPYFHHRANAVRSSGESLLLTGVEAMTERGLSIGDFDWILPHQVSGHIADLFAERFPVTRGKVFVIADRTGNLGSAAIWVGLDRLRRSGKLRQGQKVLVLGAEASKFMIGGFVYTH